MSVIPGVDNLIKIGIGLALLAIVFTTIFALLPYEYASFPLSTWHTLLSSMEVFFNDSLGFMALFADVALLLIVVKLVFSLYIVGFSIKLIQWVISFVK